MDEPPLEPRPDRREPERTRPPWYPVVLPAVWLILGAMGGYAIIKVVRTDDAPTQSAQVSSKGPSAKPTATTKKPTPKPTTKPTPQPTTQPTTEPTQAPASRAVPVSVYNQIGIGGLAGRVAGQLRTLGWTVGTVADWRGGVPQDTVYFPAGQQAEATLLAQDLAISRVLPATANMSTTGLTVVLASPR